MTSQEFLEKKTKLDPQIQRFNHSAVAYKKKIIIFGGEKYNIATHNRHAINDTRVFELETLTWQSVTGSAEYIDPRRSHACCLVGKNMIVHGGVDTSDHTKSDLWTFNLDVMKWSSVITEGKDLCLSHHTMSGAYANHMDSIEIFSNAEPQKRAAGFNSIFKEGVFIFGGKDPNGKARGELYHISTESKKKYSIERVEPIGSPPHARYGHAMLYWHKKQ